MKVFKKTKSKLQQEEQGGSSQKEPLTPQKSEDESDDSSADTNDEGAEGVQGEDDGEGGAMSKIFNSIAGICGGGSGDTTSNDEWCNMKEGMAEI